MKRALVDQDMQPISRLERAVGDELTLSVGAPNEEDALIDALRDVDVIFCTSRVPVTGRVLEATDLTIVAKIGTGLDNVDLETARKLGIPVTYTPGMNAMSVAEHTVGLLLSVLGHIPRTQEILQTGGWRDDAPLGRQLYGKTVGIVGFGNIGSRTGALLSGFQPELLVFDPYIREIDTELSGATRLPFDDLLERSDVVIVNAELTRETEGLIGERELSLMGDHAVLVNTARGAIVDEDALVAALREGEIAGAALDVFEEEPLPPDSPLHSLDNVVTTPHTAGVREETRERTIHQIAENVLTLLANGTVPDEFLAVRP